MMNKSMHFWILLCTILSGMCSAHPTITDADWMGVGQSNWYMQYMVPSDKGRIVYVHAVDRDGNLYVCPHILLFAGGLPISAIAKWDHKKWSEVGTGINGNAINALSFDSAGALYAGGKFDTIEEGAKKWDGASWSSMRSSLNDEEIWDLAIAPQGIIYAISISTDTCRCKIIKWDGAVWSTLGTTRSNYSYFASLVLDNKGNLYVCGDFDTINTLEAHSIAKWDGKAWNALGGGLHATTGSPYRGAGNMCFNGNDLYVVGYFDTAGSIPVEGLAKWDGNSWSAVGNQCFSEIDNLETDNRGNIYLCALGSTVAKWDGNAWSFLDDGINRDFRDLIVDDSGDVYQQSWDGWLQWRNSAWTPICTENGLDGPASAFAFDSTSGNLYVGGSFSTVGNKTANRIALWNGSSWSPFKGIQNNSTINVAVNALAIDNHGILYAVGTSNWSSYITKWDGAVWSTVCDIHDSTLRRVNFVHALAIDAAGNLYAGGEFDSINRVPARNIAKWDGIDWSPLGEGIKGNRVQAFIFDKKGRLYAAGDFDTAGTILARNIAKWDGVSWSALGDGIQKNPDRYTTVNALAIDNNGNIYAGGSFSVAGEAEAHNIAKWDGATWSSLGDGLRSDSADKVKVSALSIADDGSLYTGGSFTFAGEVEAHNIAKWDGITWGPVGSGTRYPVVKAEGVAAGYSGNVRALACDKKGTLYVGGDFGFAGNKTSLFFAQCNIGINAGAPPQGKTSRSFLSFEGKRGLVRMHFTVATEVHVNIYSLLGREVYRASELMAAGDHGFRLKTSSFAQGLYVARITAGNESLRCRIIVGQ